MKLIDALAARGNVAVEANILLQGPNGQFVVTADSSGFCFDLGDRLGLVRVFKIFFHCRQYRPLLDFLPIAEKREAKVLWRRSVIARIRYPKDHEARFRSAVISPQPLGLLAAVLGGSR